VLDYLKAGKPEPKAFAQARAAMMDAIGVLGRRVRGSARQSADATH